MVYHVIQTVRFIEFNRADQSVHSTFKEIEMAVNNPHGHNQYTDRKKMENADPSKRSTASTTRGGSDQHAEAGRQSHKNDDKSSSSQSGRQGQKNDG